MPVQPEITTRSIRRYYEDNTRLFLAWQGRQAARTIHRALWLAGVTRLAEALNGSSELILAQVQDLVGREGLSNVRIADLGCGVGASLFYLLARLPLPCQAIGLTLSPTQARLAANRAFELGCQPRCAFAEADFLHLPLAGGFDFCFSVEAFVHALDPGAYFEEAARLLRPGGRLALVDDFLSPAPGLAALAPGQEAWLAAYRSGWQAAGLSSLAQAEKAAGLAGLHLLENRPLGPYLRLAALPDGLARLLRWLGQRLGGVHAIVPSMTGSLALQQCLKLGLVEYRLLVFERGQP